MYALLNKGSLEKWPIGVQDLKKENPTVSFPSKFSEFDYTSYGVVEVSDTPIPDYNPDIERVVEYDPVKVNGAWLRNWVVEELPDEEKQQILDNKAAAIRSERDRKLAETDWRVIVEVEKAAIDGLGIQYPTVWADYRQALRDITKQPGFPLTVDWPVPPQ